MLLNRCARNTTKSVVFGTSQNLTILVFRHLKASMSLFAQRLKAARLRTGLSQERLGIEAGLDPMSASARMNRYEQGKRVPDAPLVERIAAVLGVPVAYLHSGDDEEAELLLQFHRLNKKQRAKVIAFMDEVSR